MKEKNFFNKVMYLMADDANQLPRLVVLVLALSLLDLAGIGLIAPYVSMILQPELFTENYKEFTFLFDSFETFEGMVSFFGLVLICVFCAKTVGGMLINKAILVFCYTQGVALRTFLMSSYQNLPYEEYLERNSSEYIYNMQTLAEQYFKQILQSILRIASESVVIILISILLMWTNFLAFSMLFCLMTGALYIYDRGFRRNLNLYGELSNKSSVAITRGIREGMNGIKEIRILEKESYFYSLVKKGALDYLSVNIKSQIIATAPRYFLELIIIAFIVLISIVTITSGDDMASLIPVLGMFGIASIRILPSINQIIGGIVQIRIGKNAVDILYNDVKKLEKIDNDNKNSKVRGSPFESLTLQGITFKYKGAEKSTINGISLSIQRGESIGIIGQSGAGKSTLMDIILGLLKPGDGEVLYNNEPISECKGDWMSKIAYIPQEIFLLDDSLRKNITLTHDEALVDQARLLRSIEKARLNSLVEQLPDGVDTKLGDNGLRISGGQRQRVALARAFYHNREVLIMDESTSSLDKQTEQEIVEEIKILQGKITMIVISHNMSTIEHCDKVYCIQDGAISRSR
jgi:ABC-type bacteriocin/lantibiotic exporter with double-glycine peptidase domain